MIAVEHQHKASERNYSVHKKEILAMKYSLVELRIHLLIIKPFVNYTNHASLRTMTQSPHLLENDSLAIYSLRSITSRCSMIPGRKMLWLMRCHRLDYELTHVTTLSLPITDLIRAAYAKDDHCIALQCALGT